MTHLSKLVHARRPVVISCASLLALLAQGAVAEASQDAYGDTERGPAAELLRQGSAQQQAVLGETGKPAAPQSVSGGEAPAAGSAAEAPSSSSSSLPFTGLDMALLLGAAGVFIGAGLVMRRLANGSELA
jgi:hypothetical protein